MPSIPPNPRREDGATRRTGIGIVLTTVIAVSVSPAVYGASLPPTESTTGLVVSSQRLAAEAGVEILRQGGNAIDAAVAVGYAEAVVNPCCGNIGGGGFLTAHLADGRDAFLDFRETAPQAATEKMYLAQDGKPEKGASLLGWKAVAVPGSVAGLDAALEAYGSLPRSTVMAPAIRLARDGFVLERADADLLARSANRLRADPNAASVFLHSDGSPYRPGERLAQPDLARTLEAIAKDGPSAFYHGAIPAAVETASHQGGGMITAQDFASYHVREVPPLTCTYRGHRILSAPPPSSGGTTLCETLNVLEAYDLHAMGFHGAEAVHVMTEALRYAYHDRDTWLGDPAFVRNPLNRLLSKDYAARLRGQIGDRAIASTSLGPAEAPDERAQTTSYSVLDRTGSAVSVTYTLNGPFGAGVMAPGFGFLLNDEMDDFTLAPRHPNQHGLVMGSANAIAPGKRPLSSMAPTVVLRDGRVEMILGSPGGPRIITAVLQTILNVVDYGMDAQSAVDAPRLHHQLEPDVVYAEPFALSPDTQALLVEMGYRIEPQAPWGAVALIASGAMGPERMARPPSDGMSGHGRDASAYYGANDSRRPAGAALAP